ncbi:MAG: 30S ribosomal protein THX [Gammaproteobacteria bacterium]|nr:30S ribosomal protein THX [Gammaproteobacteria bacterium]
MGKGDRGTTKGKIFAGSHGKTRPKKRNKKTPLPGTQPKQD